MLIMDMLWLGRGGNISEKSPIKKTKYSNSLYVTKSVKICNTFVSFFKDGYVFL